MLLALDGRSCRARTIVLAVAASVAGLLAAVPAHASATTQVIWPLGDSITYGLNSPGGYRAPLDAMLRRDGIAHMFVGTRRVNSTKPLDVRGEEHHDGHRGYRIDQVASDLTGVAGASTDNGGYWLRRTPTQLTTVLLMLGTNDVLQRYDPGQPVGLANAAQRARFETHMVARLRTLILRIRSLRPHATVVVATIPPLPYPRPGYAAAVAGYNAKVRVMAGAMHLRLADVYSAMAGKVGMISSDHIHPTAAGYQLIATVYDHVLRTCLAR